MATGERPARSSAAWVALVATSAACTTVAADVRRRDLVVAIERVSPIPPGWRADPAEAIHVVTAAETVVVGEACARVERGELVVETAGDPSREAWRGPLAAVRSVEVRRVHGFDARLRADADDAGATALAVTGLAIGTLLALFSIALESH